MALGKGEWRTPNIEHNFQKEVNLKFDTTGWKPDKVDLDPVISYYRNNLFYPDQTQYDLFFAFTKPFPIWDNKKPRCNRPYMPVVRENIFQQEWKKAVPVLTSHLYGKRPPIDWEDTSHRRANMTADMYRRFGIMTALDE
ncbi:uncharacterized protein LOC109602766 [Aethina tumida]|uniref:uncharacterized protein LOC109602766 n=1 Tax=Aethina tumida TaxID=116153 RepID=UPI00096B051D|nr:uncharacterized protein LOC109602766 [Aethina tumida]